MTRTLPGGPPPAVLTFSGHDPSGGAGVQADIEALAAVGCRALTVVTALTVQDTRDVQRVEPVDPGLVEAQARTVLADLPVAAFKIGLLGSAGVAETVAAVLRDHPQHPVVLDPITAAGGGTPLAGAALVTAMRGLLQRTTLVTPNSVEARRLAGRDNLADCAEELQRLGATWVLITGTHETGETVVHRLFGPEGYESQEACPRLAHVYHGSGCTLAAAVAGLLAWGVAVPEAVSTAQRYTWDALRHAAQPGHGQHLPDRLFWAPPERGLR
jgi:hydroxymethylpyrimidine/phosphomethylpyrimidine kinase